MSVTRIIFVALALPALVSAADVDRLFAREIKPLLAAKCFACHGQNPALLLGEFDLTNREGLLRGGKSGRAALAPGNASASPIYLAVTWANAKLQMPPKENDRLTTEQIESLRDWINAGAPWPDDATIARYQATPSTPDSVQVETSGGLADDWTNRSYDPEDLWAFQPVIATKIPGSNALHPIDAFHRAKLEAAEVKPANRADKLTLVLTCESKAFNCKMSVWQDRQR